jgi:hypothetical protein
VRAVPDGSLRLLRLARSSWDSRSGGFLRGGRASFETSRVSTVADIDDSYRYRRKTRENIEPAGEQLLHRKGRDRLRGKGEASRLNRTHSSFLVDKGEDDVASVIDVLVGDLSSYPACLLIREPSTSHNRSKEGVSVWVVWTSSRRCCAGCGKRLERLRLPRATLLKPR